MDLKLRNRSPRHDTYFHAHSLPIPTTRMDQTGPHDVRGGCESMARKLLGSATVEAP